jgi:hypothetical protein
LTISFGKKSLFAKKEENCDLKGLLVNMAQPWRNDKEETAISSVSS